MFYVLPEPSLNDFSEGYKLIAWNDQNCLRIPIFKRQLWAQILTNLHEPKMDSTLLFNPFEVVHMNFATKNLLACLCSASPTIETISIIFSYLENFYLQIQNPINLISMSTTYLKSSGPDLSENELFQCVSILLTGTSIPSHHSHLLWLWG